MSKFSHDAIDNARAMTIPGCFLRKQPSYKYCLPSSRTDGWMDDSNSMSFLTVFQSYQDDGMMIIIGWLPLAKFPPPGGS